MTEKEKFFDSLKDKQDRGLKNVAFIMDISAPFDEESLYAELNRMEAAVNLPDREVLGKYSI